MTVRNRLEDARILLGSGSRDGAFIQVLVAAAATSKKRYPHSTYQDNVPFKSFIYDEMGVITGGPKFGVVLPFEGKDTPLEDILYIHFRNSFVHEAEKSHSVAYTETEYEDGNAVHILHLSGPLGFPAGWIEHIATAVWLAPENDELWADEVEKRKLAREQLGDRFWDGLYCRRPIPEKESKEKKKGKSSKG
jgi:hypothetical protein